MMTIKMTQQENATARSYLDVCHVINSGTTKNLTDLLDLQETLAKKLRTAGLDPAELQAKAASLGYKPSPLKNTVIKTGSTAVTQAPKKKTTKVKKTKSKKYADEWKDLDDSYLDSGWGHGKSSFGPKKTYKRCADDHPLLELEGVGKIMGANCYHPPGEWDVQIMLCSGASFPAKVLPWDTTVRIRYPITDMSVPKDVDEFKKIIDWTIEQMRAGKVVHVGCIGGHGRTGTFLAALINVAQGKKDAIHWLRKNYCTKAVESAEQVNWLHKHFGIDKAPATKSWGSTKYPSKKGGKNHNPWVGKASAIEDVYPLAGRSVFGSAIKT